MNLCYAVHLGGTEYTACTDFVCLFQFFIVVGEWKYSERKDKIVLVKQCILDTAWFSRNST